MYILLGRTVLEKGEYFTADSNHLFVQHLHLCALTYSFIALTHNFRHRETGILFLNQEFTPQLI
jgi:hypothetical protein